MKIDNMVAQTMQLKSVTEKNPESQTALEVDAVAEKISPQAVPEKSSTTLVQELTPAKIAEVNDAFKANGSELQFSFDKDAGKMILYLKDAQTGETLQQFPDKEMLRISKQIDNYLEGLKSNQNPKDAMGQLVGLITDKSA